MMDQSRLVFVKLGGSLITDKTQPVTPRLDVIQHLAGEISAAVKFSPGLSLLIGHGSGSFGHEVADRYQTQAGGEGQAYWQGFSEVWQAARVLNQMVVEALTHAGLPVIAFPPSAGIITQNRRVISWDVQPIKLALYHGLIPVVYGDVVFDIECGGTILSTEDLFIELARSICPQQILIAGLDLGVYADPQQPTQIVPLITPQNMYEIRPALSGSQAVDVTGGMLAKVEAMVTLVEENPSLKVHIFSGRSSGNLQKALSDAQARFGTRIAHQAAP
jgi:isopentenyl phosphate kinase